MIKDCVLKTNQPTFFAEVKNNKGEVFATIKAKTRTDIAELEDKTIEKIFTKDEKTGKFKISAKTNSTRYALVRIRQALTGHEKVGWELADKDGNYLPITEEVIAVLPEEPFDYYAALSSAVAKLDNKWDENKAGISKN